MKKILNIFAIVLISIIAFPFGVKAANISTLEVTNENNKLTVSGTTESDVYAVAILVYSGSDLVHMETCSNDEGYACELSKTFDAGTYTIKVADYDGGDYISKNINISNEENPKTVDNIFKIVIIGCISLISLVCLLVYKKRFN